MWDQKGRDEDMLKVLLVDDEEEIREGMARGIDWHSLGFEAPMTAENGVEALEIAEKQRPDVIITDIQMPLMDGLDFIEKASKMLLVTKFIVFSGYDLFEYAQKAVSLKVDKYLLKPFSAADLGAVLTQLAEKIQQEKDELLNMQRLQERFAASIDVFRENFLISCLNGLIDQASIKRQQKDFGFSEALSYRLVLFELHPQQSEKEQNRSLLSLAIKDIAQESIQDQEAPILFFYGEYLLWLAVKTPDESLQRITNEICAKMTSTGTLSLAGISQRAQELSQLNRAYHEAQLALDFSSHLDQHTEFSLMADDIQNGNPTPVLVSEVEARRLVNALKYGDETAIKELATEIFQVPVEGGFNRIEYRSFLVEWVGVLSRNCTPNGEAEQPELIGKISQELESKVSLPFEEGCRWFAAWCVQVSQLLQQDMQQSSKGQIMQGLDYLKEHYADPELTAESLSNHLHLSPAYFSVLFKKYTGQTFVAYLTELRVAAAKELLEHTEEKTYLIAEQVGYPEANYFSYVFKKATGASPTRYRKQKSTEVTK